MRKPALGHSLLLTNVSVADMISRRTWNAHPHLAWAMWGLDEIEATLASIESRLHSRASAHPITESAMMDMRMARDAFRNSIAPGGHDTGPVCSKADLEDQWVAFESSVQNYLDTVDRQVREQETIFRVRADAQSKAWRQSIDNLRKSAEHLAADNRGDIETAIEHLGSEADVAKARLDKLNTAEGASWAEMRSALEETRAALDQAHRSVADAFEHSASNRGVT
jgi:chromosome segregation ATPase